MQHERGRLLYIQGRQDRIKVLGAFGQNENFSALQVCLPDIGGNGLSPRLIIGKMLENILDTCFGRQIDTRKN